jgi:hypothetical protein
LEQHRGRRHHKQPPPLTIEQILAWADAHRRRTGRFPSVTSGDVEGVEGENWSAIHLALRHGSRGLPAGWSLARLLAKHRGHRPGAQKRRLTIGQILAWADIHYRRAGRFPNAAAGKVYGVDDETWLAIDAALQRSGRGLPGGSSLHRLLVEFRGKPMQARERNT